MNKENILEVCSSIAEEIMARLHEDDRVTGYAGGAYLDQAEQNCESAIYEALVGYIRIVDATKDSNF